MKRLPLILTLSVAALPASCADSSSVSPGPPVSPKPGLTEITETGALKDSVPYTGPTPPADSNHLRAQPWVEPVSQAQTDSAAVHDGDVTFPLAGNSDVLGWRPGRVIVAAPSTVNPTGNPFGFARRVVSVSQAAAKIEVRTETVRLDDVVSGDLQTSLDFKDSIPVDISGLDKDWLAAHYYTNDASPSNFDFQRDLVAEPSDEAPGVPVKPASAPAGAPPVGTTGFFDFVEDVVEGASSVVNKVVTTVKDALTTGKFTASEGIGGSLEKSFDEVVLDGTYAKTYKTKKSSAEFVVQVVGKGSTNGKVAFTPGLKFGVSLPVVPGSSPIKARVDVDAKLRADVNVDLDIDANIRSVNPAFNGSQYTAEIKNRAREAILGKDNSPPGGFTKVLYVSTPRTKTIYAGPVPVILVMTTQVNLECGFEVAGGIKTKFNVHSDVDFKYWVAYNSDKGGSVMDKPGYDADLTLTQTRTLLRGRAEVACGLVPRFNVFAYDTIGLYGGLRGSLVGRLRYDEKCPKSATSTTPEATTKLAILWNMGLQAGARAQFPGASWSGPSGAETGAESGIELWNREWSLWSKSYPSEGFGYCDAACQNKKLDPGLETDVDCGGSCGACAVGKKCAYTRECEAGTYCSRGECSNSAFGDGLKDALETDVDCGGPTDARCETGKGCDRGTDCKSGFCIPPKIVNGVYVPGKCTDDHCEDGHQDSDEGGIDCGGSTCKKCGDKVRCDNAADCATPYWDGQFCITDGCKDHKQTLALKETDIDCGGLCGRCGAGQLCKTGDDCADPAVCIANPKYCLNGVCGQVKWCALGSCDDHVKGGTETDVDCGGKCNGCGIGDKCLTGGDCLSRVCTGGVCQAPTCTDGARNDRESDVDCGGSCASKCALGLGCEVDKDCASGACSQKSHRCVEMGDDCTNGVRDQNEGDVDCGGNCQRCGFGSTCSMNSDCAVGDCSVDPVAGAKRCRPLTCANATRDPDEGDVDCSLLCGACPPGKTCKLSLDCASGTCAAGVCAAFCANGRKDANEADVDCGGACAKTCGTGQACSLATDCAGGVCAQSTCQAPSCTDGLKNGGEGDVDCGGTCAVKCADGRGCALAGQDCESGVCSGGVCQRASCGDNTKNGGESDVDCGGPCAACATAKTCGAGEDCASGVCSGGVCVAAGCSDLTRNGTESDVDCGGTCAAKCADLKHCALAEDCVSGVCRRGVCVPPSCNDDTKNGSETDVDCGGPKCGPCETGQVCAAGSDCGSKKCTAGKCAAPSCVDGVQNGVETDVDCGGKCTPCATAKGCVWRGDCASGVCSGKKCAAPSCTDKVKNGAETDVDCGGTCGSKCATGAHCSVAADCTSGLCQGGVCVVMSCTDGIKDLHETDVDCGGGACAPCAAGRACVLHGDCAEAQCEAGVCVAASCVDQRWNGDEPDVDCGGSCPNTCADGKRCGRFSDCTSGTCRNVCVAPTCFDHERNGTETDVDCGGSCAAKCGKGQACSVAADCTVNVCTNNVCTSPARLVFTNPALFTATQVATTGDSSCQTAATNAGLTGTFVALFSTSTLSAKQKIVDTGRAYRTGTGAVLAANHASFFSATHLTAMSSGPLGEPGFFPTGVWTGSTATGDLASDNCVDWSTNSAAASGMAGDESQTDGTWAAAGPQTCDGVAHVLCVEQ